MNPFYEILDLFIPAPRRIKKANGTLCNTGTFYLHLRAMPALIKFSEIAIEIDEIITKPSYPSQTGYDFQYYNLTASIDENPWFFGRNIITFIASTGLPRGLGNMNYIMHIFRWISAGYISSSESSADIDNI